MPKKSTRKRSSSKVTEGENTIPKRVKTNINNEYVSNINFNSNILYINQVIHTSKLQVH